MGLLERIWESFWGRFCLFAVIFQVLALVLAINSETESLRSFYYEGMSQGVPQSHGRAILLFWPFD